MEFCIGSTQQDARGRSPIDEPVGGKEALYLACCVHNALLACEEWVAVAA